MAFDSYFMTHRIKFSKFQVSKLKSSRSGYSHRGYPNQKVDPITARILSANQKRRAIAGNQAGEIKKKNMQLYGKKCYMFTGGFICIRGTIK